MPELVTDSLVIGLIVAVIVASLYFGALPTPYGTFRRRDRPEAFYGLVGTLLLGLLVSVYLFCVHAGLIADLRLVSVMSAFHPLRTSDVADRDFERSIWFFRDVLGLNVWTDAMMPSTNPDGYDFDQTVPFENFRHRSVRLAVKTAFRPAENANR
jgi:hypothetical protein